jgi:hypothetical protein
MGSLVLDRSNLVGISSTVLFVNAFSVRLSYDSFARHSPSLPPFAGIAAFFDRDNIALKNIAK